ncbi:MAG TPA: hypothetical protein VKW04_07650 [Planctomycetota bacterium]|nr:hypothetical protein [Planctomycetota bacterium]
MADLQKPLILVVDGDLGKLTTLDSLLGRAGNLITTCSTFPDAQKAVAGNKVNLVIIGRMGDEGEELALTWKVKDISPSTKVLLLKDSKDYADSVAPLDPGADELLSAPYTNDELLATVTALLAKPSLPPSEPDRL